LPPALVPSQGLRRAVNNNYNNNNKKKKKKKIVLVHALKTYRVNSGVRHSFLTSGLDGGEW
jgi:hypothetical protein